MSTISDKLLYLNNTKQLIKDKINNLGGNLTSENTFRSYSDILTTIYKKHPKVSDTGTSITLTNIKKGKMLINLNPSEISQASSLLPSGYTQVDYIDADGYQYIDTGYKGNLNTNIEVKCTNNDFSGQLLGDITTSSQAISCNFANSSQTSRFGNKYGGANFISYITNDVPFEVKINKQAIFINGTSVLSFNADASFTTTNNLYLLTRNSSSGAAENRWIGKIYYCKIYENNALVRNFIPCYRNNDNEVGLYDLVNNVFYTNQGTSNFTKGNDTVLPSPECPIDVNVITGNNNIVVENKNLIDMTYALIGYSINATTGLNIEDNRNACGDNYISVLPNTKYTFSVNVNITNIRLSEYKNDKSHIQRRTENNTNKITITTTSDTHYLRWSLNKDNQTITQEGLNELDLQLEQGNEATTYIEHQKQNYSITLSSKNLLDFNNITIGKLGTYGTVSVDGDIITFTANNQAIYGVEVDLKNLNLKPNTTYTISNLYTNTGTFGGTNGWRYYDGSSYTIVAGQKTYFNFTTGDGTTNKLYFYLGSPTTYTGTLTLYNIQLLEGLVLETDIPDYQIYYNLEYCKIEEHADQLFKNIIDSPYYDNTLLENEWYLKKNIGKMIFNNNNVSYAGTWLGYNNVTPILIKKDTNDVSYGNNIDHPIFCTKAYHSSTISDSTDYLSAISVKSQADYYYLIMKYGTTLAQARNILNGGCLYYQITTPQYIHISQTDYPVLKGQLDNLYNNARSYDKETNIIQINDNLPFNLNAKALKKNDN